MKRIFVFLFLSCSLLALSCGKTPEEPEQVIINEGTVPQICSVGAREKFSLDGAWNALIDIYETGYYSYRRTPIPIGSSWFMDRSYFATPDQLIEYDFDAAPTLDVPGDWNTQRPELYMYEGTVWYRRKFDFKPEKGKRYFIYFEGVNYESVTGLNGEILGRHEGGFTPFCFEVTGKLREKDNSLIVKVDNRRRLENVPTVNFDWWNYGGITRSVHLVETPSTFIRDFSIGLQKDNPGFMTGSIAIDGENVRGTAVVSIPELGLEIPVSTNETGLGTFSVKADPERWSPGNPKLYTVHVTYGKDSLKDKVGFRTIETKGHDILLNGERVFLKGICIHEEKPSGKGGRAFSEEDARTTLGWAKELGCNFVRLAHYPHNENMVRMAEEMGIMVWSEIPVYWTIDWENPITYANACAQLEDNIGRDHNRCNIIIWSVANETPVGAPGRKEFLYALIDKARELDGTRLVGAAMETAYISDTLATINDAELFEKADIGSFNQYVGWYDGTPDKCDVLSWTFALDKPVIISEFGGGAKYGYHGPDDWRFTEEYQERLYRKNLAMLDRIGPQLAGTTPWILKDFRSPKRALTGIQDDYNRKGLVSEKGEKKAAFYVVRDWYSTKQ